MRLRDLPSLDPKTSKAHPLPPSPNKVVKDGHQVLNNGWWPTYFGSPGVPEDLEAGMTPQHEATHEETGTLVAASGTRFGLSGRAGAIYRISYGGR